MFRRAVAALGSEISSLPNERWSPRPAAAATNTAARQALPNATNGYRATGKVGKGARYAWPGIPSWFVRCVHAGIFGTLDRQQTLTTIGASLIRNFAGPDRVVTVAGPVKPVAPGGCLATS